MAEEKNCLMEKIVSLCKRRGFIFPTCEIYGGFANSYSYGPYGAQLKKNIKDLWWKKFVESRIDMVGIDGPILLHPKVWQASGHTEGFNDAMVDCKECKKRFRADHLVKELTGKDMEGDLKGMTKALKDKKCPECGKSNWSEVKKMNMMFKTEMNGVDELVYLRPETAGAIFVDFKNIIDSMRVKIPFGIAQIGKAFRNEISPRNFLFRCREFEQADTQLFIKPNENKEAYEVLKQERMDWHLSLGIRKENLRFKQHENLVFYAKDAWDIEYRYPWGFDELEGIHDRSDYDLTQHQKFSGVDLQFNDPETGEKYIPWILETSMGMGRLFLAVLADAYTEDEMGGEIRSYLKFNYKLAPIKVAVFPLLKNKPELVAKAREVYTQVKQAIPQSIFDDNGNIGKRYRRQDEIGTPYCVTVDFQTLEDETVTLRDRDTGEQSRIKINELENHLKMA
jgi:glycyl-tRNA synthetase